MDRAALQAALVAIALVLGLASCKPGPVADVTHVVIDCLAQDQLKLAALRAAVTSPARAPNRARG